ncbi:MAG: CPBP family intramembrane metalloprotease [Pirellulales bacterium]|nr:CPBP family intramembrane metalloprotease [Pirellulales bacterium]
MQPIAPPVAVALLAALAAGSLAMWVLAVRRLRAGEPLISFEPRRPVPWGVAEFVLIILLYFVIGGLVARFLFDDPGGGVKSSRATTIGLLLTGLASLAVIGGGALVLVRVAGATWRDLGWSRRDLWGDLRLGLAAGLAITAPVFAVQSIVTTGFGLKSEHPLIELVERERTFSVYLVALFLAVGVAPLAEEFLFRVLLQGWLEARQTRAAAERQLNDALAAQLASPAAALDATGTSSTDADNPYAAPRITPEPTHSSAAPINDEIDLVAGQLVPAWWPLVTSAAIFAALHVTQGPDPIALFPLALVLGYLYRQTHRLLPSLVAHAFLNAASMLLLWLNLG